ncbi:DUF5312 family protein [Treponema succinifaciens]|uniref:DUF5312 family protein n=1 Tax=Treponema succinifaciens TaxID=167 RepID=UPI003FF0D4F6
MENKNLSAKSNFEVLASNLSKEERSDILSQIQQDKLDVSFPSEKSDNQFEQEKRRENKLTLSEKLRQEPLLFRFILWLKSLFLNSSIETVYNNSVLASLSKNLEHDFPDVIDCKNKLLLSGFYSGLLDLKRVREFFKPSFDSLEQDSGLFYFLLGFTVMPEIVQDIKSSCDVYSYSFEKPLPADIRNILFTKLDGIVSGISSEKKIKMSACSREFERLRMFVKIPLGTVMSKFSSGSSGRTCSFSQIKDDFDSLARILLGRFECSDTTLSVLFMSGIPQKDLWNCSTSSYEEIAEKVNSSSAEISLLNTFAEKLPLKKFGKVISENSLYSPLPLSYSDLWFQKFKEQWKVVLDKRLKMWNKDFKKSEIKKKLKIYFSLEDFPKYPSRPWKKVGADYTEKYESSIGFLNYYLKNEFPKYKQLLSTITLEGKFSIKENMYEFSDMISTLNSIITKNDFLVERLSSSGEYGSEITHYASSEKEPDKEKLRSILFEIEGNALDLADMFAKFLTGFENLLFAMLGEKSTVYYGPLANLNKIMGADNKEFKLNLEKFAHSVKFASEVLQAIIEMENISV